MATQIGLIRSFYGWLTRKERALKEAENDLYRQLPVRRPTSLRAVLRVARRSSEVLQGTEFEERAAYWADLFEGIARDGWQGDLRTEDRCRESIRQELTEATSGGNMAL